MKIEIKTYSAARPFMLKSSAPEGVTVEFDPPIVRRDLSQGDIVLIAISTAASIPAGVLVNWLTEKLKGKKSTKITIKRRTIDCENSEIRKIIEDELTTEND